MENLVLLRMPIFVCLFVYISMYLPNLQNPESTRKILRTRLERNQSSNEEIDCRLEDQRNLDLLATCIVNSCQGKDA